MPRVAQGGIEKLRGNVGRSNGYPADAPDLTLTLYSSDGHVVDGFPVAIPPIVREDLGLYYYDWSVPIDMPLGDYTATWHGTVDDAPAGGSETVEVVEPGAIETGPLDLLRNPEDYEAIRNLLGVTLLDAADELIESPPFGPHAELLVKNVAGGWEDIPSADPRWTLVRLAASYATAALMAESVAKGGFLGLARPDGQGRDWDAHAKVMWSYFDQYKTLLAVSGAPSTLTFIVDPPDFEAVAVLVGTTPDPDPKVVLVPVTQDLIELSPFGPAAERVLKAAVVDWASNPAVVVGGGSAASATRTADGATVVKVDTVSGFVAGDWIRFGQDQWRQLSTVGTAGSAGTGLAFFPGLAKEVPLGAPIIEVESDGSDRWGLLKLAAEYGTAYNILSARGSDRAAAMWRAYVGIVSELVPDEATFLAEYNLTMMLLAGPTRAAKRDDIWDLDDPADLYQYHLTVP